MRKFKIAALTGLLICFTAVPLLSQDSADKYHTITSSMGPFQFEAPADWQTLELHDDAEVEIGNEQQEAYLILLAEAKEDMYGWNLEKHSRVTLGNLLGSLDFPKVIGPVSLEINGKPAVQYEIQGATQGLNLTYLHTTVETDNYFNQILAWSLKSRFEEARPKFEKTISSFQEVESEN